MTSRIPSAEIVDRHAEPKSARLFRAAAHAYNPGVCSATTAAFSIPVLLSASGKRIHAAVGRPGSYPILQGTGFLEAPGPVSTVGHAGLLRVAGMLSQMAVPVDVAETGTRLHRFPDDFSRQMSTPVAAEELPFINNAAQPV
ncbi:hypothetical protein N7510_008748 [Penicillium lagena]|uniref:uncharacterized protein n=1 Tax=Penicillium lagena TaxID=94218 RepID=UPI00253FB820|nr:uncharacterized protein N7510_008748 [Penicillium lagena]KAJ5605967.1 hypothetical protein N7510_008748 [Penicillium lagena]